MLHVCNDYNSYVFLTVLRFLILSDERHEITKWGIKRSPVPRKTIIKYLWDYTSFRDIFDKSQNNHEWKMHFQVHGYLTIVWLSAIFFASLPLFGWNEYTSEVMTKCTLCLHALFPKCKVCFFKTAEDYKNIHRIVVFSCSFYPVYAF